MVARADEKELSLCADGEHAVTAVRGRDKEGRWSGGGTKCGGGRRGVEDVSTGRKWQK